jgi:hypothetical protein
MRVIIRVGPGTIMLDNIVSIADVLVHRGIRFSNAELVSHSISPATNPFLARDLDAMAQAAATGQRVHMWLPGWMATAVLTQE